MNNLPKKARYSRTLRYYYQFSVKYQDLYLPFDPFKFISDKKWHIVTYKQLAAADNTLTSYIRYLFEDSPGAVYIDPISQEYVIAYDDTEDERRILFTLSHEISHILLCHIKDFDYITLFRNKLTNTEYKILENEADVLARNLLCPYDIIYDSKISKEKIYNIFNVSKTASKVRMDSVMLDMSSIDFSVTLELMQIHENFVFSIQNYKKCNNCGNLFLKKDYRFCPICGKEIKKYYSGECFSMKYKEYETNEDKALKRCLKCDNEDIQESDKFCKICGYNLRNFCSNDGPFDDHGVLESNARYCPHCGNESTFFKDGFLKSWWEERGLPEPKSKLEAFDDEDPNSPF